MRYVPGYENWRSEEAAKPASSDYQPFAQQQDQPKLNHAGMLMLMLSSFDNPDHARLLGQQLGRLGKQEG